MNFETKLIDYLYGEMTETEKRLFEQELAQNPDLQKELAELQESRDFLAPLPDVQAPVRVISFVPKPRKWLKWVIPISMAASLLLLLKMADFQVNTTENGLTFSFGAPTKLEQLPTVSPPQYVTLEEVQQLLTTQRGAHQKELLLMDSIWQNRIVRQEQTAQKSITRQLAAYQAVQKEELKAFATTLREQEIPELASMLQNLQAHQQQELQLILGQFWVDWQTARTEDLNNIKEEFTNVYQNQTETDAFLVNMIAKGEN